MVNLTGTLGREVPTPREVLEVIRPQLRFAALIGPAIEAGIQHEPHPLNDEPDPRRVTIILSGEDQNVSDALFGALQFDAMESVKAWARDCGKVYDGDKLALFVGAAMNECFNGEPSDAVLDVLALDEGVCEALGHAIRRLAIPLGDSTLPSDEKLGGVAARYFQKV